MAVPSVPIISSSTNDEIDAIVISINNGTSTVTRNEIQRRIDAAGHSMQTVGFTNKNQSYVDREAVSGVRYRYRVRATNNDGNSAYSGTLSNSDTEVSYNRWWIRHLSDSTRDIKNPFIDNDPLDIETREEQAVFNPLQRRFPVVIKDVGIKAARIGLSIQFLGEQAFRDFEYLRSQQTTLLLQSPMPRQWYFVFDNTGTEKLHNTVDAYRHMEIGIIEVERPNPEDL